MCRRWFIFAQIFLLLRLTQPMPGSSNNYKISPKPCSGNSYEGTCMFVWECIKSEGQHIGMCVDSFMFGSCCAHNLTENVILTQTIVYKPTKPFNSHKNRPSPVHSYKPSLSGTTTIHRPHGAGTIVVRPSGIQTQRPYTSRPSTTNAVTTVVKIPSLSDNSISDLDTAASISTGSVWNTPTQTVQWHMTTQPNFITKPKPTHIDKISTYWTKPKPTKKPIAIEQSTGFQTLDDPPSAQDVIITKPKPQSTYKPTKPLTTTTTTTSRPTTTRTTTLATATTSSTTTTAISSTALVENNDIPETTKRDTLSAAKNTECGLSSVSGRPETRIVGGKNAPFGRWPWQVSVRRTSFFGFSSTHRCGGAVINANWIATAGHCVDDLLTSQIRIRVGEYDFSHVQEQLPYIERAVERKVVHPKYNFFTYEYDLALVKLDSPLEFAPHISPICLPAHDDLLIGENATVTGWGRLSEGGTLPSVLQEVLVPIVSNDKCKTMFLRAGRNEYIPEIFLCAGHETGGQDSCQGDSGGPLQVKGKDGHFFLAGIISWGIGCAEANLPGVCTRISKFTPWILENVG
ncbi:serine proteinase stubble [Bradysia coprophila]|uniref:serine proteinase stubble n=1 Tax=Bradysia coprophila TaxID=38358 RepID=UPI00187DDA7E|nr:serine proteinase stubble [Bradysia coprophila]XP_037025273.1 serine proteinase stubble [Bradysia coprophila]XP_037025281.1 serine proteinase stubble [Bradysia coprophila]